MKKYFSNIRLGVVMLVLAVFSGCGASRKAQKQPAPAQPAEVSLSADEQRKFDYYLIEAMRLKRSGSYDASLELLRHCLSIDPTSATVLYQLAHYYATLNMPEKAKNAFEKAVALNPDNFWYKQTLAGFYLKCGLMDEATRLYEGMVTQFPKRNEPLVNLMALYERANDYPGVVRALNLLERKEGKSEMITMQKFRIYLQMDSIDNAFREIESLVKEYPNDSRYKLLLAEACLDNNRTDEALAAIREVLAEEPDNPQAQLAMAGYAQQMGNDSLHNALTEQALLNQRLDNQTRMDLMRQLIIIAEQTPADTVQLLSVFEKMTAAEKENADMSMLYAQYMITKKMPPARVKPILWHILKLEPDNTAARLQLLSYAVSDNNYKEAIDICSPALKYNPDVIEFYYYLGISYYQNEQSDEALATFSKGAEMITSDTDKKLASDFYLLMGDIYHEKGKDEMAYAAYDSSLVYFPENIAALNNYAYYLSLEKKNLDKAEEMSYKTVKAEPQNATYLDTYAWILFEKGRYAEAKLYMDQVLLNDKEPGAAVLEHCGDIYYMNGLHDEALEFWKKAKEAGEGASKMLDRKIKQKKYIAE